MSEVVQKGKNMYYPESGTVQCKKCGCVFSYIKDDVGYQLDSFGGEAYFYVQCPNNTCRNQLIIRDKRLFGFIWRLLNRFPLFEVSPSEKAKFIKK